MPSDQPVAGAPFQLLKLPAEMRNMIYRYCTPDVTTVKILPRCKGLIMSSHPLHRVSHQVRQEFGAVLEMALPNNVTKITADIEDMTFDPLRFFFQRISKEAPLANIRFGRNPAAGNTVLVINFTISKKWSDDPNPRSLIHWAKFLNNEVSRGASIAPDDITYAFKAIEDEESAGKVLDGCFISNGIDWWAPAREAAQRFYYMGTSDRREASQIIRQAKRNAARQGREDVEKWMQEYGTGDVFYQTIADVEDPSTDGKVADAIMDDPTEYEKEVPVVVKRGAGVEYTERTGSPYLPMGDIRKDFRAMSRTRSARLEASGSGWLIRFGQRSREYGLDSLL
ncbi:uncharacterized protein LTR77_001117 [Saxophila tyrrhenica]|uniref:F-box domain-containing protein n=1 Tax=Saxophila tyrrhenica TaxID=1690608 RepID=A0AAV9PNZ8_9PEZI|nr:hypothetical protein LTR77_001117 [Saxophila tyrrhenica]